MNLEQMKSILVLINGFDSRRVANDETVDAWHSLFEDVDYDDAAQAVRDFFLSAVTDTALTAGNLVTMSKRLSAQRAEQERAAAGAYGTTCGRAKCRCTHTECEAGWVDTVTTDARGITYDQVKPCPQCRGDVGTVAASAKNRPHFQSMIRDKSTREQASSDTAWDN